MIYLPVKINKLLDISYHKTRHA